MVERGRTMVEQELKKLIKEKYQSIRKFAGVCGIPHKKKSPPY